MNEFQLWFIIVPLAAAGLGLSYYLEKARSKALRAAGAALGLRPTEDDEEGLPPALRELALFQEGHSRSAENLMWSERREYVLFDYSYTVGSGKNSTTHRQTVGAFHLPGRGMPEFTAAPEEFSDMLAKLFGGQDIDFPGDPKFNKAYRLRGADEVAIRDFFSVGGTQYLAARPGWTLQAKGDWLLAYRPRKRVKPAKLRDFLWDLQGLYGALLGV